MIAVISLKNPTPLRWAASALLLWLSGCVSIDLEDLATAECAVAGDCQAGATCIEGACVACGAEICDGVDNDCDGNADEDFDLQTDLNHCGACNATCDGVCTAGACEGPDCVPADETCNGADDDCDGNTDEGVLNACGACGEPPAETCDGTDEDCDGTTDEGLLNACGRCGEVPEEVCNGADDDCDGTTDEGVLNACGRCGAAPAERCNDVDDDCDGNTDEDFPEKGEACSEGLGLCEATAEYVCDETGIGLICPVSPAADPTDELCGSALDEDCDGQVDEGFVVGEVCTVGDGGCATEGMTLCSPDGLSLLCDAVAGAPTDETCNTLDDDCDGLVDESYDLDTDLAHCGACGEVCTVANGDPTCVAGDCLVDGCAPGFEDTDLDASNGCECEPAAYDPPDSLGLDANCDGVDGTAARSVFVSASHGTAGADGTIDAPVATLIDALALVTETRNDIILSAEDHRLVGLVVLAGDVHLFGGYTHDPMAPEGARWVRTLAPPAPRTRLVRTDGGTPALAVDVGASVTLTALTVDLESEMWGDPSKVGIWARGCRSLDLVDVVVHVPSGEAGAPGLAGDEAPDTADPGEAAAGTDPGVGGRNPECPEAAGGQGGVAVPDSPVGPLGLDGEDSPGGGAGGLGATALSSDTAVAGGNGEHGGPGAPAAAGRDGLSVDLAQLRISLPGAISASDGNPGVGGGGGGATYAWGGGGGGAGGCAGRAGNSGQAGGASLALVVAGSCRVSLTGGALRVDGGGSGGPAGPGTLGAAGSTGGESGAASLATDGDGGRGGDGGCGGHGVGGAGGPSVGVLRVGPTAQGSVTLARTDVLLGREGAPGAPVDAANPCGAGPIGESGARLLLGCCVESGACGYDLVCVAQP